jgi:hypothetical protein
LPSTATRFSVKIAELTCFGFSRLLGMNTTVLMPARAPAAATAFARLPVEGQANTFAPSSVAALRAQATTRSLKEFVGLVESSFTQSLASPSSLARFSAASRRVNPGSVLGLSSMSAGTGSSAL